MGFYRLVSSKDPPVCVALSEQIKDRDASPCFFSALLVLSADFSLQGAQRNVSKKPRWCFWMLPAESHFVKMEASVWSLPLTGIHHLEWLGFSNLSQLTSQMQAQHSQTADSFLFRHSSTIDTYWLDITVGAVAEAVSLLPAGVRAWVQTQYDHGETGHKSFENVM